MFSNSSSWNGREGPRRLFTSMEASAILEELFELFDGVITLGNLYVVSLGGDDFGAEIHYSKKFT